MADRKDWRGSRQQLERSIAEALRRSGESDDRARKKAERMATEATREAVRRDEG